MEPQIWTRNEFFISTNKELLDLEVIDQFFQTEAYWAKEITKELLYKLVVNSTLCYGVYEGSPISGKSKHIGFARVVSDFVKFALLADVFVLNEYRGNGLGKWLVDVIVNQTSTLKGVGFHLATRDAHGLYSQFGFEPIANVHERMIRPFNIEVVLKDHGLEAR